MTREVFAMEQYVARRHKTYCSQLLDRPDERGDVRLHLVLGGLNGLSLLGHAEGGHIFVGLHVHEHAGVEEHGGSAAGMSSRDRARLARSFCSARRGPPPALNSRSHRTWRRARPARRQEKNQRGGDPHGRGSLGLWEETGTSGPIIPAL